MELHGGQIGVISVEGEGAGIILCSILSIDIVGVCSILSITDVIGSQSSIFDYIVF